MDDWKTFESLREQAKNIIDFEKKIVTTNKRRTKIVSRYKSMLYLWKNITKKFFNDKNYQKVRGHCHFTGKYRGAAHIVFVI